MDKKDVSYLAHVHAMILVVLAGNAALYYVSVCADVEAPGSIPSASSELRRLDPEARHREIEVKKSGLHKRAPARDTVQQERLSRSPRGERQPSAFGGMGNAWK